MIIRSGLIRSHDGISFDSLCQHWRQTHAPLALRVAGMRGYSQNHIVMRIIERQVGGLHRVDGISQLYFDDVDAMKTAMASKEQAACIADLKKFLSDVTLLIQLAGHVEPDGIVAAPCRKFMFLLSCHSNVAISATSNLENEWKFRVNPVIAKNVIVDQLIARGEQIVNAVVELWTSNTTVADDLCHAFAAEVKDDIVAGFEVSEEIFLTLPSSVAFGRGAQLTR